MPDLVDILLGFDFELAEMKRRFENGDRPGTVQEVDPRKHRCRLRVGGTDDEPFLTPWIPYVQTAGDLKLHSPPSVGQQMMFRCPDGDFRNGYALPYTWSNDNPSPSDRGDEHVMTFGQSRQIVREGQLRQEVGPAAAHEVQDRGIASTVGSSRVKVSEGRVQASAGRVDLN